jgi:Holliday junction resolvasome RuvABC endonuclease subunit
MQKGKLLAVDPSLTCSGWAVFSIEKKQILGVGKVHSLPSSHPLETRLRHLQEKVTKIFDTLFLSNEDILVCEAPTTMLDPKAAFKVERVRGIFEAVARARGIVITGRINPRTVQYEVMGLQGKQLKRALVKEAAVKTVSILYTKSLESIGFDAKESNLRSNQDIVDAILIGAAALVHVENAHRAGSNIESVFECSKHARKRKDPRLFLGGRAARAQGVISS